MITDNKQPLLIVNIYLNINEKVELPIKNQSEEQINKSIKQFVKQFKLKQKAIPIIRQAIHQQLKLLHKNQNNNITNKENNWNKTKKSVYQITNRQNTFNDRINNIAPLSLKKKNQSNKKLLHIPIKISKPKSLQKNEFNLKSNFQSNQLIHKRMNTCVAQYQDNHNSMFYPPNELNDTITDYKEYQLKDIEQQMHRQVNTILLSKIVKKKQFLIDQLFQKLTKNNPIQLKRIHPDYISFSDLTEGQLCALQDFFQLMTQKQLGNLDLPNMKALLVKYKCENLLKALTF